MSISLALLLDLVAAKSLCLLFIHHCQQGAVVSETGWSSFRPSSDVMASSSASARLASSSSSQEASETSGTPLAYAAAPSPPMAMASMILRIKRKRGAEPADALYIQQAFAAETEGELDQLGADGASASREATLAHVAKRRSSVRLPESPSIDSLASGATSDGGSPSRRRSSRAPLGSTGARAAAANPSVFRLAETISASPANKSGSPAASRNADVELRKRVTKLQMIRRNAQEAPWDSSSTGLAAAPTDPRNKTQHAQTSGVDDRNVSQIRRFKLMAQSARASSSSSRHSSIPAGAQLPSSCSSPVTRAGTASPQSPGGGGLKKSSSSSSLHRKSDVIREIQRAQRARMKGSDLVPGAATVARWNVEHGGNRNRRKGRGSSRIIDLVVDPSGASSSAAKRSQEERERSKAKRQSSKASKGKARQMDQSATQHPSVDSLGDVFRNMLVDHLKAKNADLPDDLVQGGQGSNSGSSSEEEKGQEDEDDYVYDIYYREIPQSMPSRAAANGAAEIGYKPSQVAGGIAAADNVIADDAAMEAEEHKHHQVAQQYKSNSGGSDGMSSSTMITTDPANHFENFLGITGVRSIASLNISNLNRSDWDHLMQVPTYDAAGNLTGFVGVDGNDSSDLDEEELVDDSTVGSKLQRNGDPYDSWDEGEDEDSNEEDFYRNDYPEQELSEDDEFGLGHEYRRDSDEEEEEEMR